MRKVINVLAFLVAIAIIIGVSRGDELYYVFIGLVVVFALLFLVGLIEKTIRRLRGR